MRGLLREFGIVIPVGAQHVVPMVHALTDDARVPPLLQSVLVATATEIRALDTQLDTVDHQIAQLARAHPTAVLLQSVPGIGALTATALVAAVGDIQRFPSGRHFASFLGLTAKEASSGEQRHLGGISKRGDGYLRMLVIHGGRSLLWSAKQRRRPDALRAWGLRLEQRRGHNVAAVAVANKVARIVWAVWRHGTPYRGGAVPD